MNPRETLARIRKQANKASLMIDIGPLSDEDWELCATAARTDVPRLVDALEAVLKLHVRAECPTCGSRDGEGNEFHKCDDDAYCEECDLEGYPCPTVEAITQALSTA